MQIGRMLAGASEACRADAARPGPAVLSLARMFEPFALIGSVSRMLDEHCPPARDAYGVGRSAAGNALRALAGACGPGVILRHCPQPSDEHLKRVDAAWRIELLMACDEDLEAIAAAMVELAAALQDALSAIAGDDTVMPAQRTTARTLLDEATDVWGHYGGDSGGW